MPGPWQSAGQRGGLLGRARRLQPAQQVAHAARVVEETRAARDQLAAVLPVVRRTLGDVHPGTLTAQRQLDHWTSKVN